MVFKNCQIQNKITFIHLYLKHTTFDANENK